MSDLIFGATSPTDQAIGITGGIGITLISATSSDAGLMSANDKTVLDLLPPVTSGTYTPACVGPATYTPAGFRYIKVGHIVQGGGLVEVSGGVVGDNSFAFDLPFSSVIYDLTNVTGTLTGINIGAPVSTGTGNYVNAYFAATAMAAAHFTATDTDSTVYIEFTYIVL
ncbi:hypothetical protein F0919_03505 [Taibaiella lutea]|uniref:Uncharacterized protein n=1 Tax=Taibaiella lutea TaxID=2608001 RepID=A0A5M6CU90_9BACT|nr:hypothetical protein [Taibaiella lutea]KAA5536749.1 hypothetical protein F0919_03505 [Taibaiella lutea]